MIEKVVPIPSNMPRLSIKGTKRTSDALYSPDYSPEHQKKKCERNVEDLKMNKLQTLFSKHNFLLDENNVSYERVHSFIKDLISCWTNETSEKDIEVFVKNDLNRVLGHYSVRRYFKHNLERYCSFIADITDKLCDLELLLAFLHDETTFDKALISERGFYKFFLDLNLPTFVTVIQKYDDPRLFNEVCTVFKKCILSRNVGEFESYLNEVLMLSESNSNETLNLTEDVIMAAISAYRLDNQRANLTYKIIVQSLFISYNDFSLIYKFLVVLIELLGFDLGRDFELRNLSNYSSSNIELSKSLNILSVIMEVIKNNKTDLSCCVKVEFSTFVENVVNSIFGLTKKPNKICYNILKFSVEVHPLLVERNLDNLLIYTMLANNTSCDDEYASFLLKIFETYAKLHRIQNLISKMLPVMKCSINRSHSYEEYYTFKGKNDCQIEIKGNFDIAKVLPEIVLKYFTETVVLMASWQVMNLFKTFVFHLSSAVTSFADSNDGENSFLEFVCKFFSWLLRSIRMAENTVTITVMEKFNSGMKELKDILSRLGEALLKQEHNQTLVGAFLNLSHDWTEMYIIFNYYNREILEDEEIFFNVKHPSYIHSFLTTKQWFLLSQRITNFGESNCKHIMLKLQVQKLRTIHLFGNEVNEHIQREVLEHISSNVESDIKYIISDKFISEYLLDKIDSEVILNIAEQILRNAENDTPIPVEVSNSQILSNAVSYIVLSKIAKAFKTKSKTLFFKVFTKIDKELYFGENQSYETGLITLKNIYEQNLWNKDGAKIECGNKTKMYLNWLRQLPIPYLCPRIQSLVLLCLFSMHKNFWDTESNDLKDILEELIIGLLQAGKVDWMNLFEAVSLVKNITLNFARRDNIISLLSGNIIKDADFMKRFVPGVNYLIENIDAGDNLQHSILIWSDLQKVKKSKNCKEFKDLCQKMIDLIFHKHFELVTKREVDIALTESFSYCLRHCLRQEGDGKLPELVKLVDSYLHSILELQTDNLPKGSVLLFSTVLHNKQALNTPSDLPLRIWKYGKLKEVPTDDILDFSQLLCLIFEHIPNEEFENVSQDLFILTEVSIEKQQFQQLLKQLNTWSYILTSSFNPVKFKVWQQILEKLLFKLSLLKTQMDFNEQVFDEIMQFEGAVIQHNQLLLSPAMLGVFLMSPIILLQKEKADFYYKFYKCAGYLDNLLKHRNFLIMDRLPTFLKIFRLQLTNLCDKCSTMDVENMPSELDKLADCAHQLEKFVRQLVQFKKHIARIAPHLIADILQQYERTTLYPKLKVHLNNCIYSLLSLCDHHAVSYLLRVLSSASTELFKIMFVNYKKFYRFTGKV